MPSELSTVSADQPVEELRRELVEAREQLVATSDILRLISSSRTDLAHVFDTILINATRLCEGNFAGLWQFDGKVLEGIAQHNLSPGFAELCRNTKMQPGQAGPVRKAALERRTIHVADITVEPGFSPLILQYENARTVLAVPLLREKHLFGVVCIWRREVHPFTEQQIALVQTFADQAVIAIENTRLFEAEQTRTTEVEAKSAELRESLEYQTAASDVLNVISRSKFELQPVLDTIVETAARLCRADMAHIRRREGDVYVHVAGYAEPPGFREYVRESKVGLGRGGIVGRVLLEKKAVQIPDVLNDSEFALSEMQRRGGFRTVLGVPLTREGVQVGIIVLLRHVVEPFTEKQIELVTTFADQAVIAIENTRLFEEVQARTRELTETLEYRTATSDVLSVISRSKFDLQPVLQSVVQTAARLCRADNAIIYRLEDGACRFAAGHGHDQEAMEAVRARPHPIDNGTVVGRAISVRATVQIEDVQADPLYQVKDLARRGNVRSVIGVPLMRAGEPIGAIALGRSRVEPFNDRQIELVTTFADQAVIAIENTRLFEEVQASKREL